MKNFYVNEYKRLKYFYFVPFYLLIQSEMKRIQTDEIRLNKRILNYNFPFKRNCLNYGHQFDRTIWMNYDGRK